jgi:23S rRNA (uridine2552-2'-O)-methyltransferase
MSRLKDRRSRHDGYYRRAQKQNYASRAVFKLQEADKRFHLFAKEKRVLDLGCWPGSWSQYAAKRVGARGTVVGIDLKKVEVALPKNVHTVVGDIRETDPQELQELAGGPFDVVISDMAPNTTGIRSADVSRSLQLLETVLDVTQTVLYPGGHFIAKVFQGSGFDKALLEVKNRFKKTKNLRPKGTRKASMELYMVGLGKRSEPLS